MSDQELSSARTLADYTRSERSGDELWAELSERWITPFETIYGGYAAAVVVRAVADAVKPRRPASMSTQFIRVIHPGKVQLEVEQLRATRRTDVTRVRMLQAGEEVLVSTVWSIDDIGTMDLPMPMLAHQFLSPPLLPDPEQMRPVSEMQAEEGQPVLPISEMLEVRQERWSSPLKPESIPPVDQGWVRNVPSVPLDEPGISAAAALIIVDGLVVQPVYHPHAAAPWEVGYFPMTLDLYVQFFDLAPIGPWLEFEATAPVAAEGLVGGRTTVWSQSGSVVAYGASQMVLRLLPHLRG